MKNKPLKAIFIVLLVGFSMCSEDPQLKKVKDESNKDFVYSPDGSIRYNGDYLEFSSPVVLESTIQNLREGRAMDFNQWLTEIGFVSMKVVFEREVEAQEQFMDAFELKHKDVEISKISKPVLHKSQFVADNADKFEIDEDGLIKGLTIFHPDYAAIVNTDGILKMGGHLFQYTDNSVKIIINGDDNKIPLLKNLEETDNSAGVVVNHVITNSGKSVSGRTAYSHNVEERFARSNATLRILGDLKIQWFSSPIYGPYECEPGCGETPPMEARVSKVSPDCYCTYPIIGYDYRTLYKTHMAVELHVLFWWRAHHADRSNISVRWMVNGVSRPARSNTTHGYSNTYLTVYDGPMVNITEGSHNYSCEDMLDGFHSPWEARDFFRD